MRRGAEIAPAVAVLDKRPADAQLSDGALTVRQEGENREEEENLPGPRHLGGDPDLPAGGQICNVNIISLSQRTAEGCLLRGKADKISC